jgi:hypothetical protein
MEFAMTREPRPEPGKPEKASRARQREDRLKAALKANMARRKAQLRARQTGETGIPTAGATGPEEQED